MQTAREIQFERTAVHLQQTKAGPAMCLRAQRITRNQTLHDRLKARTLRLKIRQVQ